MPVYEVLPKSNHAYLLEVVKTIEKLEAENAELKAQIRDLVSQRANNFETMRKTKEKNDEQRAMINSLLLEQDSLREGIKIIQAKFADKDQSFIKLEKLANVLNNELHSATSQIEAMKAERLSENMKAEGLLKTMTAERLSLIADIDKYRQAKPAVPAMRTLPSLPSLPPLEITKLKEDIQALQVANLKIRENLETSKAENAAIMFDNSELKVENAKLEATNAEFLEKIRMLEEIMKSTNF